MAVFNKNSLAQISGFNNQILSGELVYQQKEFWNIQLENDTGFLPTTGATIDAQIIRRLLSNVMDTRNGLTFDIADYIPAPTAVDLTIDNIVEANGSFTLIIDSDAWGLLSNSTELDINATNCVGFSGRIKISLPVQGITPAQDLIIFLLFLVRSDGVIN